MRRTSVNEILRATGGRLVTGDGEAFITEVVHDSREAKSGCMFVAVVGKNRDGHEYIRQTIANGCRTLLVSHTEGWFEDMCRECASHDVPPSVNVIMVDDTVTAMGRLAAWYIRSLGVRCVAVTGSVGKTSVRDFIYYVLSEKYNCGRNLKNYNNNIGLPLSVFRFDDSTQTAVLEMGMDDFGEISYLSGIAAPEVGVITNIGVAHIEKLGSREGIFRAKMELTENIRSRAEGGALIFAGDGEFLTKERTSGDYAQIEIGYEKGCDYIISDVDDFGVEGIEFTVERKGKKTRVKLPVPGMHNAVNGAIAVAVGERFGIDPEESARGLAKAALTGRRLRRTEGSTVGVIDDTYNANPASMMSALDVLARSRADRRVAILGDMFELGEDTEKLHRRVGEYARSLGIDSVIAVGDLAANIAAGAGGVYFRDKESLLDVIGEHVQQGDLVLVKASRGMKMEEIVEALEKL